MVKVVITGVGPDQPGIVAGLTGVLADVGANIEDSTMTLLAGEFAMIVIVSVPSPQALETLQHAIRPLEDRLGITLQLKPIASHLATRHELHSASVMISVAGQDRTGITANVSKALAQHQVNITDLNAQVIPGDEGPVYIMMIEAVLPPSLSQDQFAPLLQQVAQDLGVEISFHPLESVTF